MHVYGEIKGTLTPVGTISASLTIPSAAGVVRYEGEYEITPSASEQIIPIAYMMATEDITIKPIPNNYGLITYNGSTITVS